MSVRVRLPGARGFALAGLGLCFWFVWPTAALAQGAASDKASLPSLTAPVNDFAGVIDETAEADLTRMIRALQEKTRDAVVVATVASVAPYPDIRDYAVDLFENHGRGIGERGEDTGALVLLSIDERKVWIEVGYGLEGFITDGFAGETSREYMVPFFRQGQYGEGLKAGVTRLIGRIAQERGVSLEALPATRRVPPRTSRRTGIPIPLLFILAILLLQAIGRGRGRRGPRYWGGGPWSGWSGGVGPFGGSYGGWGSGGGYKGGGFGGGGGGFGGFGGGRSGGGGGGGSW